MAVEKKVAVEKHAAQNRNDRFLSGEFYPFDNRIGYLSKLIKPKNTKSFVGLGDLNFEHSVAL